MYERLLLVIRCTIIEGSVREKEKPHIRRPHFIECCIIFYIYICKLAYRASFLEPNLILIPMITIMCLSIINPRSTGKDKSYIAE